MTSKIMLCSHDHDERDSKPAPPGSDAFGASGTARVLVVEDDWFIASSIETILEQAGYKVVGVATSANEAVHMVEMHRPDVVTMDIRLRGARNGIDAAVEIDQRFGVRCLFVSANVDPAIREQGQTANPLGWLPKPFSGPQLLEAIKAALSS